jgi:hypothetical protein
MAAHRNGGHHEADEERTHARPQDFVFILHFSFLPNLSGKLYLSCSLLGISFIVKGKKKG